MVQPLANFVFTMKANHLKSTGYSKTEEFLNTLTHGLGLVVAIVGLVFLILKAKGATAITSVSIYGGTLVLMFLASSIYHGISHPRAKAALKLFDHSAIYLLIAGTYTPLLLVSLEGTVSLVSMIFIWTLALVGISFKLITRSRFPKVAVGTYLAMGWFAVLLAYPLIQAVPAGGLWLLLAGGMLFSIGVLFYVAKHRRFTHAIWHLFVVGGCGCHFATVYGFVI
ncbi:hemolysin III family protein [Aliikangiella sp. G2MR2-5]|uniref:PAQR family membrane homeostasis protein TrhA n=1 Tax=Aliikangiella sp. G2MR2-5 TaxID=2788943 RepID=UPI001AEEB205|nr:hemolysin III family protein [Aliikangiella sp. G2MR2-5]